MINLSKKAEQLIKSKLADNNTKNIPKIDLKKGGCAGNILILTLVEKPEKSDIFIECNDIVFAISQTAKPYIIDDIYIDTKSNLGLIEIIIKNNNRISCKCGKSFK